MKEIEKFDIAHNLTKTSLYTTHTIQKFYTQQNYKANFYDGNFMAKKINPKNSSPLTDSYTLVLNNGSKKYLKQYTKN